jgi:flagellar biosynthesis protein FlhA
MNQAMLLPAVRDLARSGLGAPLLMIVVLAMVVMPLPAVALDVFFTFNIALSLVVLLVSVYTPKPLDFAVFPTVLLITTLLRLALNVASTRVVLLHGHAGGDAAGRVIQAFGEFVVGGNYAVGLVVFAILVIVNFAVVTKGAGRVSEVSARFTLDALPGKQMAIDADLNAGLINQQQARDRRAEVSQEADFYGSMDGASKFVRGDAVAGILILAINIVGGLAIGVLQHGLDVSVALQRYSLLTVGDGLVAQIPSLLLSTAAAMMVTRASRSADMGEQVLSQLFGSPRALGVTAGIVGLMGLVPGMPNLPFLALAGAAGFAAHRLTRRRAQREAAAVEKAAEPAPASEESGDVDWDDLPEVDPVGLEVGYRLIPLVDKGQGGALLGRIKGVRKKLSRELGFLVPPVHIKDNLDLAPTVYRISLRGVTVAEGEIFPDREMAIDPGHVSQRPPGTPTKDPAFGLEAVWIDPEHRELAQTQGCTVVDAGTVVATHLNQLLLAHAHELLGYEEVQQLLERLARTAPKLVEDLVPKPLQARVVTKVLQNLLREQVPIRDIRGIAESLAEHASESQDPGVLTSRVRVALGRQIVNKISGLKNELAAVVLDPTLERLLHQAVQAGGQGEAPVEPGLADRLHVGLAEAARQQDLAGKASVLLVADALRPLLSRFTRGGVPGLQVLAFSEIPEDRQIRVVATVGA